MTSSGSNSWHRISWPAPRRRPSRTSSRIAVTTARKNRVPPDSRPASDRPTPSLTRSCPEIEASPAYKAGGLIAITFDQAPQSGPDADSSGCCDNPTYPNLPSTSTPSGTGTPTAPGTTTPGTTTPRHHHPPGTTTPRHHHPRHHHPGHHHPRHHHPGHHHPGAHHPRRHIPRIGGYYAGDGQ